MVQQGKQHKMRRHGTASYGTEWQGKANNTVEYLDTAFLVWPGIAGLGAVESGWVRMGSARQGNNTTRRETMVQQTDGAVWTELRDEASRELLTFLREGATDEGSMKRAKIAATTLSTVARHEATESAKEQTRVVVGRAVFADTEQYAAYLRVSAPTLGLKQIPETSG